MSGPPPGRPALPAWDAVDVWAGLFAEARSPEARCKVVWLRAEAAGGRLLGNGAVRLPPLLAGAALGSLRTQALLAGVTLWEGRVALPVGEVPRGEAAPVPPTVAEPGAPSGEVAVAGRAFVLGAVYAPRSDREYPRGACRLLRHSGDSLLPGGRVHVALVPSGRERVMAGEDWAAWAGEPVGDVGR